jgi:TolB protein
VVRRCVTFLALVAAVGAIGCAPAFAGPKGAQLAVQISPERDGTKLLLVGPEGKVRRPIEPVDREEGGFFGIRPIWSPDGQEIAFFSWRVDRPGIAMIDIDGSDFREVDGGVEPFAEPAFDPTTGELVVWGSGSLAPLSAEGSGRVGGLWSVPTDGSEAHFLRNPSMPYIMQPYSFAPDGTAAGSVELGKGTGIVTFDPARGGIHTVVPPTANGNYSPMVSPDGSEIAYLHRPFARNPTGSPEVVATDLMLVPFSGGKPKRLARIPDDAAWPSWDPSGSRIAFTKEHGLFEVNADGTCLTEVLSAPEGRVYGAAWRPGPGRGAGPINCGARRARAR